MVTLVLKNAPKAVVSSLDELLSLRLNGLKWFLGPDRRVRGSILEETMSPPDFVGKANTDARGMKVRTRKANETSGKRTRDMVVVRLVWRC